MRQRPINLATVQQIVGENIQARRKDLELSREQLAQRIGYDRHWLKRVELGQELPAHLLPQINAALEIPPEEPFKLLQPEAFTFSAPPEYFAYSW